MSILKYADRTQMGLMQSFARLKYHLVHIKQNLNHKL